MACKKSELVSAINSFGSARATGDGNLIAFSVNLIGQLIDTLEFEPEEEEEAPAEEVEVKEAEPVWVNTPGLELYQ